MTTVELLQDLQARDIRLTVDGDRLTYDAPEGVMTEDILTLLRQHKTALVTLLQQAPETAIARAEFSAHEETAIPGSALACAPRMVAQSQGIARDDPDPNMPLPAPLTPQHPCVVCSSTERWGDAGIWRCKTCWPTPLSQAARRAEGLREKGRA
jgi:hypothetical protein